MTLKDFRDNGRDAWVRKTVYGVYFENLTHPERTKVGAHRAREVMDRCRGRLEFDVAANRFCWRRVTDEICATTDAVIEAAKTEGECSTTAARLPLNSLTPCRQWFLERVGALGLAFSSGNAELPVFLFAFLPAPYLWRILTACQPFIWRVTRAWVVIRLPLLADLLAGY